MLEGLRRERDTKEQELVELQKKHPSTTDEILYRRRLINRIIELDMEIEENERTVLSGIL